MFILCCRGSCIRHPLEKHQPAVPRKTKKLNMEKVMNFQPLLGLQMPGGTHDSEQFLTCLVCGKKFARSNKRAKTMLEEHMNTHTGEKPYPCKVCGKRFACRANAIKHAKAHSAVKSLGCPYCDKKFHTKQQLASHERTHTGDRPYSCSLCDKTFAQLGNLKLHEKKKHSDDIGDKVFSCSYCDKKFAWPSNLSKHERKHRAGEEIKTRRSKFEIKRLVADSIVSPDIRGDPTAAPGMVTIRF